MMLFMDTDEGGPGPGPGYVTSGLVFELDAKDYSSGQTWANKTVLPADSSAQTDFDYNLGASSSSEGSDPTINGTGTDGAYWSFDGDDYFTHTLAAASMPAFLREMHKDGKQFTIEIWMLWAGSVGSNIAPLFDSGTGDFGGADMSRGVIFCDLGNIQQTDGRIKFRIKQDSGGAAALHVQSDDTIPSSSVQMLAVSYSAGSESFLYRSGDYAQAGGSNTFTATLTSPGTNDANNRARIGARGDGGFRVPNGTHLYLIRVYNRALSKSEMDQNWNATKARYGL